MKDPQNVPRRWRSCRIRWLTHGFAPLTRGLPWANLWAHLRCSVHRIANLVVFHKSSPLKMYKLQARTYFYVAHPEGCRLSPGGKSQANDALQSALSMTDSRPPFLGSEGSFIEMQKCTRGQSWQRAQEARPYDMIT